MLKNRGEVEDGVYDWMTINNGKGWEAGVSPDILASTIPLAFEIYPLMLLSDLQSTMLSSSGYESRAHRGGKERDRDRERERAERHAQRAAAAASAAAAAANGAGSGAVTPNAAAREGKIGRQPSASATPQPGASAMAVKGVTPPTAAAAPGGKMNRMSSTGHPYANTNTNAGGAFDEHAPAEYGSGSNGYRTSAGAMQTSTGGGAAGLNGNGGAAAVAQDYHHDDDHHRGGFSLVKFLTCRCG